MKKLGIVLALFAVTLSLSAEEGPNGSYDNYFGIVGGLSTGHGLAYRSWAGDLGAQINFLPYVTTGDVYLNGGVTGLLTLQDLKWTKFFGYVALSGTYSKAAGQFEVFGSTEINRGALGAGAGFEFIAFDHIALDLMGGYQLIYDSVMGASTSLSVEGGLFYRL